MAGEEIDHIVEDHRSVELCLGKFLDCHGPAKGDVLGKCPFEMPADCLRHPAAGDRHIHAPKPVIAALEIGKVGTGFLDSGACPFRQFQHRRQMA